MPRSCGRWRRKSAVPPFASTARACSSASYSIAPPPSVPTLSPSAASSRCAPGLARRRAPRLHHGEQGEAPPLRAPAGQRRPQQPLVVPGPDLAVHAHRRGGAGLGRVFGRDAHAGSSAGGWDGPRRLKRLARGVSTAAPPRPPAVWLRIGASGYTAPRFIRATDPFRRRRPALPAAAAAPAGDQETHGTQEPRRDPPRHGRPRDAATATPSTGSSGPACSARGELRDAARAAVLDAGPRGRHLPRLDPGPLRRARPPRAARRPSPCPPSTSAAWPTTPPRALMRARKALDAGAVICEIARSEISYTDQRPAEYTFVDAGRGAARGLHGPGLPPGRPLPGQRQEVRRRPRGRAAGGARPQPRGRRRRASTTSTSTPRRWWTSRRATSRPSRS